MELGLKKLEDCMEKQSRERMQVSVRVKELRYGLGLALGLSKRWKGIAHAGLAESG